MASNNYGNKKSEVGMGTGIAIMAGMVSMFLIALWFVRHDAVVRFFLYYAYALVFLPAWISMKLGMTDSFAVKVITEIAAMSYQPKKVEADMLFSVVNKSSLFLLPFAGLPVWFAWKTHRHILKNLESNHDYWRLMQIQSKTNLCIVPVVRFTEYWRVKDLSRHINLFRSLTPDELAKKHGLIDRNGNDVILNWDKTIGVFTAQLGGLFDPNKMSPHYKALASIFMTRIVYYGLEGRNKAQAMLDTINSSCNPNNTGDAQNADCSKAFDFDSVSGEFAELLKHASIKPIITHFIHEKTFLMRLLQEARSDGKLPPSEFVWLKLIDRDLWYALYGVSKKHIAKGYTEGAAAFAQYWSAIAAMEHKQVLTEPYMDEAVRALEKRLFESNMVSERRYMSDKERERDREFGRIPEA